MAWSQTDLDTIRQCIASGVLIAHFSDGKFVKYQSLDHLIMAEKAIAAQLGVAAAAQGGLVRRKVASYSSGFYSNCGDDDFTGGYAGSMTNG